MFLSKLNKYGELNNYDLFKIIAFFAMIIDHIGLFFYPQNTMFRVVGRIAFPIYAILHGISTKNNSKHKTHYSLLFLGLFLNLIFYIFFNSWVSLDILASFFIFDIIFSKFPKLDFKIYMPLFVLIIINYYFYDMLNTYIEYGLFILLFMFTGKIFYKVGSNIIDNVFCISVFATYFLTQSINFKFNNIHNIIFGILLLWLFIFIYDFKFREYHNLNSNKVLLFISRYSMELYFIHYLLFMIFFKFI